MNTLRDVRLLLIEDDDNFARLIQFCLGGDLNASFDVAIAHSIDEARVIFEATRERPCPCDEPLPRPFDVVLSDLGLPPHNGEEAVRLVREIAGRVPIVVFTGQADPNIIAGIIGAGADDFVGKTEVAGPGGLVWLERALRSAIKLSRLRDERDRERDYSRSLETQLNETQSSFINGCK